MKPEYKAAFPHRTAVCLCGSGERFKNCCSRALIAHFSGEQDEPAKPITPKAQLKKARFELARYRVWHLAHTKAGLQLPFLPEDILLVDIRAMSDYLERVLWLYARAKRTSAIQPTIRALAKAIEDPRWTDRIRYLELIWRQHASWNEDEIRDELQKFDIESIRDPDILQLYLDVEGNSLGLSRFRSLCGLISSETSEPGHRLQYRFLAAVHLDLYSDHQAAVEELNFAVSKFEEEVYGATLGAYDHLQYCRALTCRAAWTNDSQERASLVCKAIASCDAALSSGELNVAGTAHVLREKGGALAVDRRWQEALEMARRSADLEPTFLATLLEIQGALEFKQYGLARELLDGFDFAELPPENQFDYSLSLAEVACAEGDANLCATARELLLAIDTIYPQFRDRIATLAVRLADQERKGLSLELREARRLATETFDPLKLSDAQLRSVITHHRCLSPRRQARTLPAGLELPEMLSDVIQSLCRVLLDQRALLTTEMRSQEDTYSGFIALQLQARVSSLGWHVSSQDYGGRPAVGSVEFGRRDITIRKDGEAPFAIIEAVRCGTTNCTDSKNLLEHTKRLLERYDAARSAELFTVVFVENTSLEQFTRWYCECFQGTTTLAIAPLEPSYSPLRLLHGKHYTKWGPRLVNHVLLDINSHAELNTVGEVGAVD